MAKTVKLYNVLGVHQDATSQQIESAYRRLALQHQPDKRGSGTGALQVGELSLYISVPNCSTLISSLQMQEAKVDPCDPFRRGADHGGWIMFQYGLTIGLPRGEMVPNPRKLRYNTLVVLYCTSDTYNFYRSVRYQER